MNNDVESKPRTGKIWTAGTASVLLAATLAVAAPLSASATTTVTFGPYSTSGECETNRTWSVNHPLPNSTYGGCYQWGPGAAGWYFNRYDH